MSSAATAEARRTGALLVLLTALYLALAAVEVPRLTNTVVSDVDVTGWTTPLAARLAHGQRLYDDLVVPLPPGAPWLLACVQSVQGRALVLQELWVVALCHLGLGLLAYFIARRLTSQLTALLAATATLAVLASVPYEVAFSSLAQLCAWASLALGVHALLAPNQRGARRAWIATGFFGAFACAFHQLVGLGAVLGWLVAFAYRWAARRAGKDSSPDLKNELFALAAGAVAALAAVVLIALGLGSSLGGFARSVIGDAILLAGSWRAVGENLATIFVLQHRAYPSSLVLTGLTIAVGTAVARRGGLCVADEPCGGWSPTRTQLCAIAALLVLGFGGAALLLEGRADPLPITPSLVALGLGALPSFGLLFAAAFFLANWVLSHEQSVEARRVGHAFNALVLVALTTSVVSSVAFHVDTENRFVERPSTLLGFLCLFIALRRARLRWLAVAVLGASLCTMYGSKYNRALLAKTPVGGGGAWSGLYVSYRGQELLRAAQRVQALAGPEQTVLVVPEDAQLAMLFGRPRPPLRGALAFVHTYPRRVTDEDIDRLDRAPPKVIVIHPRREEEWRKLFKKWSQASGAADFAGHVIASVIPGRYRLDSSFRTVGFEDMGQLDIWVRIDAEPAEALP
jgi:hypothetical protein